MILSLNNPILLSGVLSKSGGSLGSGSQQGNGQARSTRPPLLLSDEATHSLLLHPVCANLSLMLECQRKGYQTSYLSPVTNLPLLVKKQLEPY